MRSGPHEGPHELVGRPGRPVNAGSGLVGAGDWLPGWHWPPRSHSKGSSSAGWAVAAFLTLEWVGEHA